MSPTDDSMRLNRYLARAGLGSRRSVETLVQEGRVAVNGEIVADLGRRVLPGRDRVAVDGRELQLPGSPRIYAFHKPLGVVSTLRSQAGQASLDAYRLRADLPERLVPVGRLDAATTGLLLWTDDGVLNQDLCRPASGLWKTYEVELDKPLPTLRLPLLTEGRLRLDGRPCRPCRLELQEGGDPRKWVMELHEGRKRQIRRMFKEVGLKVVRLHRMAVGPVRLGKLRPGDFRRLTAAEEQRLRDALAAAAPSETG